MGNRGPCYRDQTGGQVESKSNEIIKRPNRLTNDRNLPMQARNKISEALQHIRELQLKLDTARNTSET